MIEDPRRTSPNVWMFSLTFFVDWSILEGAITTWSIMNIQKCGSSFQKSLKMCFVEVRPETVLGNTVVPNHVPKAHFKSWSDDLNQVFHLRGPVMPFYKILNWFLGCTIIGFYVWLLTFYFIAAPLFPVCLKHPVYLRFLWNPSFRNTKCALIG